MRGTRASRSPISASIVLLSIPEFLWALFFILIFGVALHALPFTGRLDPDSSVPHGTGFLLLDALLVGRPTSSGARSST